MRAAHASHEIIALHKFEKSYYLSGNKTAVARRADSDRIKPGDGYPDTIFGAAYSSSQCAPID